MTNKIKSSFGSLKIFGVRVAGLPLYLTDDQESAEPSANSVLAHNLHWLASWATKTGWTNVCAY